MKRAIVRLIPVLLLMMSGCSYFTLVESGTSQTVGEVFRVQPRLAWSMHEDHGVVFWTIDGPALHRLTFVPAVDSGEGLDLGFGPTRDLPAFADTMTPLEIMDLVEATLARSDCHGIEKSDLKPARFGTLEGFRFQMAFATRSGLRYRGLVAGAVQGRRLHLVLYAGSDLYHYERYLPEVTAIIDSMEIL
ncbi:MAG: hypothetical protein AB1634_01685 [Thermodesulfobacteriota bacterium]